MPGIIAILRYENFNDVHQRRLASDEQLEVLREQSAGFKAVEAPPEANSKWELK